MTDININDIDTLLQRFFDGFTTIEEEKALERFFASAQRLPRRLECYRPMFGWYASGMTAPLPSARPRHKAVVWISSVAAAAAMTLVSLSALRSPSCDTMMMAGVIADCASMTEEVYVIRDGHRVTNPGIVDEEIARTIIEVEEMDLEVELQRLEIYEIQ